MTKFLIEAKNNLGNKARAFDKQNATTLLELYSLNNLIEENKFTIYLFIACLYY